MKIKIKCYECGAEPHVTWVTGYEDGAMVAYFAHKCGEDEDGMLKVRQGDTEKLMGSVRQVHGPGDN